MSYEKRAVSARTAQACRLRTRRAPVCLSKGWKSHKTNAETGLSSNLAQRCRKRGIAVNSPSGSVYRIATPQGLRPAGTVAITVIVSASMTVTSFDGPFAV